MSSIGLLQTVEYQNPNFFQSVANRVEGLAFLGGRKIQVITNQIGKQEGIEKEFSQSIWATAIKVILMFTIVVPLIVLITKIIVRMTHQITIKQSPEQMAQAREEKTSIFYAKNPQLKNLQHFTFWETLTLDTKTKIESLFQEGKSEKGFTLESFKSLGQLEIAFGHQISQITPFSVYIMKHIDGCLRKYNRSAQWAQSAVNSREVVFTCDPSDQKKGAYLVSYLEGLENDASFESHAGIIPQEESLESGEEIMMKGELAKTLQMLVDKGLIAHFYFNEDGDACHIQA